jgi:hypothetical protein
MADASAFGKPVNQYKQAMAAMQEGASRPGTLRGMAPAAAPSPAAPAITAKLPGEGEAPENVFIPTEDSPMASTREERMKAMMDAMKAARKKQLP